MDLITEPGYLQECTGGTRQLGSAPFQGLYDLLARRITEMQSLQLFYIVPFREVFLPMVLTFGAAGLFVGMFGSVMSIRKFLDV